MEILTVADCHGRLGESELLETLDGRKPDVIFFLGDNEYNDIECVKTNLKDVQMFGVIGNHDELDILERCRIENLHRRVINFDGFLIGGFGGTVKYKNDSSRLLFTNQESEELMNGFPQVDILITHDKPCFRVEKKSDISEQEKPDKTLFQKVKDLFLKSDTGDETSDEAEAKPTEPEYEPAHSGLTGIAEYIQRKRPSYVLHGHLHEPHIEVCYGTTIRCCFRTEFFALSKKLL